jgi:hypothetical protein
MTRTQSLLSFIALATLGLSTLGCEPGGVGDPCTPEDEYRTDFGSFAVTEVNVESKSFQCVTRVCLVNHFQGRVSCPYGQSEEDVGLVDGTPPLPGEHPERCRIPGTNGTDLLDQVAVPVEAQLLARRADQAVYCSCRCRGPDPNARYCECPSGYKCEELVKELGFSKGSQLAGSYCVKSGTTFEPQQRPDASQICRLPDPATSIPAALCTEKPENPY